MNQKAVPELRRGGITDLPSLEPLWISVHRRHAVAMPELAPYVDDSASWTVRAHLYRELLSRPETVLVFAHDHGEVVGYGMAYVMTDAERVWLDDTWATSGRIGEIESLGVLPSYRGRGLGTRLLEALEEGMSEVGVDDLVLGVLAGNEAAVRLYARHGYIPTWLYMSKLNGRPASSHS